MPALVMNGEKSFDFMSKAAKKLSEVMPNAQWKTLKDQTHNPSPEVIAPVLTEFFGEQEHEMSGQKSFGWELSGSKK
jgi:pimeloyl-ACP methyl ester carboxylesterase